MVSGHVETVVLLSREKVDGYVDIDLDIERLSGKSGTATYAEIRAYVEKKHGLNVSTLYIAQIKDKSDWRNARTIGRVPEKEKHLFARPRKKRPSWMGIYFECLRWYSALDSSVFSIGPNPCYRSPLLSAPTLTPLPNALSYIPAQVGESTF